MQYDDILNFWFEEISPAQWWTKDEQFDQAITQRFSAIHAQATRCELFEWRKHPKGRLAEIIVLDQFSRNLYRDSPLSYANDALALALSQEAIAVVDADKTLTPTERSFLYMPFMHSESLAIHKIATELYKNNDIQDNYEFELKHKAIIEQFGRYPHRNPILGRESTQAEIEFLQQPNSGF